MTAELAHVLLGSPVTEGLSVLPPLGRVARRLEELGIRGFPLGLPPSDRPSARHLVRFHLSGHPWREALRFLVRPRFERARLRQAHVSWAQRALGCAKRAALLAGIAASLPLLRLRPHRPSLPLHDERRATQL